MKILGHKSIVCVMALAAMAGAARGEELVRFYFAPPDGISFIQRAVINKTREVEGMEPSVELNETRTRITIKKTPAGWEMLCEPLGAVVQKNGKPAENPLVALTQQCPILYKLDSLGYLKQIRGHEKLMDLMREKMTPETFDQLSRIVNENTLTNRDTAEFNGRFGHLVELTATLGRGWAATEQFALPTGGAVTFYSATLFTGKERSRGRECVRIEFSFDTDAADIAKFLGESVDQLNKSIKGGAPPVKLSDVHVEGQGTRLIEPATMLIHHEAMERVIRLKSELPGKGLAQTTLREEREYFYEYPEGMGGGEKK